MSDTPQLSTVGAMRAVVALKPNTEDHFKHRMMKSGGYLYGITDWMCVRAPHNSIDENELTSGEHYEANFAEFPEFRTPPVEDLPWDGGDFTDSTIPTPPSAEDAPCFDCQGTGMKRHIPCTQCEGTGNQRCKACDQPAPCPFCKGTQTQIVPPHRCKECANTGICGKTLTRLQSDAGCVYAKQKHLVILRAAGIDRFSIDISRKMILASGNLQVQAMIMGHQINTYRSQETGLIGPMTAPHYRKTNKGSWEPIEPE